MKNYCLKALVLTLFLLFLSCGNDSGNSGDTGNTGDISNTGDTGETSDAGNTTTTDTDIISDTGDTSDSGNTGDTNDTDDTGNSGDTSNSGDTGNTGTVHGSYCVQKCSQASDCATGSAITDADNYECDNGACIYKGCNSDAECASVYENTGKNYKCNKNGSYGYSECTPECTTSDDCHYYAAGTTENAYDSDNYECKDGLCVYKGCNNDSECSSMSAGYGCREVDYVTVKIHNCTLICSTPADCVTQGSVYSQENYNCTNSTCVIKQCESDQWCTDTMTSDYTCYEY